MAENIYNTNVPLRGDAFDTWNEWYKSVYGGSKSQYDAGMNNLMQMQFAQQQAETAYKRSIDYNAQLQNLMATGMSRAAAIQALSSPNTDSPVPTLTAPDGGLATAQQIGQVVGTAMQFMGGVGQVISIGMNLGLAASTIQTNKVQQEYYNSLSEGQLVSNRNSQLQLDALSDVALATQAFSNWRSRTGQDLPDSLSDCIIELGSCTYDDMPDVYSLLHDRWNKCLENPYFYPAILKAYSDMFKSDYDLPTAKRRALAQARIDEYGVQKVVADILNVNKQTEVLKEQFNLIKEQAKTEVEEQFKLHNEGFLAASQSTLAGYQSKLLKQEYDAGELLTDNGVTVAQLQKIGIAKSTYYAWQLSKINFELNDKYINPLLAYQVGFELENWRGLSDEELDKMRDSWLQNIENRNLALQVLGLSLANNEEFRQNNPGLAYVFDLFSNFSIFEKALDAGATIGASIFGGAVTKGVVSPAGPKPVVVGGFK